MSCYNLRYIDEDFWNEVWKLAKTATSEVRINELFYECRSLRQLPDITRFDNFQTTQTVVGRLLY
jgi:hypothetical protein